MKKNYFNCSARKGGGGSIFYNPSNSIRAEEKPFTTYSIISGKEVMG